MHTNADKPGVDDVCAIDQSKRNLVGLNWRFFDSVIILYNIVSVLYVYSPVFHMIACVNCKMDSTRAIFTNQQFASICVLNRLDLAVENYPYIYKTLLI